jgi:hypothetical protein
VHFRCDDVPGAYFAMKRTATAITVRTMRMAIDDLPSISGPYQLPLTSHIVSTAT